MWFYLLDNRRVSFVFFSVNHHIQVLTIRFLQTHQMVSFINFFSRNHQNFMVSPLDISNHLENVQDKLLLFLQNIYPCKDFNGDNALSVVRSKKIGHDQVERILYEESERLGMGECPPLKLPPPRVGIPNFLPKPRPPRGHFPRQVLLPIE